MAHGEWKRHGEPAYEVTHVLLLRTKPYYSGYLPGSPWHSYHQKYRVGKPARAQSRSPRSLALRSVKPLRRMFSPLRVKSDSTKVFRNLERSTARAGLPLGEGVTAWLWEQLSEAVFFFFFYFILAIITSCRLHQTLNVIKKDFRWLCSLDAYLERQLFLSEARLLNQCRKIQISLFFISS